MTGNNTLKACLASDDVRIRTSNATFDRRVQQLMNSGPLLLRNVCTAYPFIELGIWHLTAGKCHLTILSGHKSPHGEFQGDAKVKQTWVCSGNKMHFQILYCFTAIFLSLSLPVLTLPSSIIFVFASVCGFIDQCPTCFNCFHCPGRF